MQALALAPDIGDELQLMRKITDYRNHAEECRKLAAGASEEKRTALIEMAKTWDMLADERERALEQKERIQALGEDIEAPLPRRSLRPITI